MKQTFKKFHSRSIVSRNFFSFLTKQYSSIMFKTANHRSPCWATRTPFTSSQQRRSSGNKCNWIREEL